MEIAEIYKYADDIGVLTFSTMYNGEVHSRSAHFNGFDEDEIYFRTMANKPFGKQLIETGKVTVCACFDQNEKIFAFSREVEGNKVIVILNMSKEGTKAILNMDLNAGIYTCNKDGKKQELAAKFDIDMKPWEYRIFIK